MNSNQEEIHSKPSESSSKKTSGKMKI
ncbi:hypothetical protein Golob_004234 [Gossypium lobatum]|uniref:Uncharacterized protein n=1 Tax=Gossypium lobatum TaxID=34289 RepID=A0A7J8N0T4_9ROSI|nr:hypothetical protein [Gossypium lobatum]